MELTLAGVSRFVKWCARLRDIDADIALCGARSALYAWSEGLQTFGKSLPPWRPTPDPPPSQPLLLREYAAYMREHRGNPENTIRDRIKRTGKFLEFLHRRRRRLVDLRLSDLDAYVMKCSKHYASSTVCNVCSMLRSFTRFLRSNGRISIDLASSVLGPTRGFRQPVAARGAKVEGGVGTRLASFRSMR